MGATSAKPDNAEPFLATGNAGASSALRKGAPNKPGAKGAATKPGTVKAIGRFLLTLILVSRPGFYHFTGFTYLIAFASDPSMLLTKDALLGLAFVLFPMNLLVYSMNDIKDVDIDKANPLKGGLHGAQASFADLQICLALALVAVFVLPPLLTGDLVWSLQWSMIGVGSNWAYNFGPQLSRVPILDMFPPLGYLLTLPFASKVSHSHGVPFWFMVFLVLIIFRTQMWFQRMDLDEDAKAGKITTAVWIGPTATKIGILTFLALELAASHRWGCVGAQVWVVYSTGVFALEVATANKKTTMALMALGGVFGIVPFMQCLAHIPIVV
jgi:4-hydroxybenzoate polyprenyltransferase